MANRRLSSSSRHRRSSRERQHDHHRDQRYHAELREHELRAHAPQARRSRKRKPLWQYLRLMAGVLLLAGLVQLVVAALTAPQFRIADVSVSGAKITSPAAIDRIQQNLIGENWIRVRTSQAEEKLSAIPTVKNVRVTRALHWPPYLHIHLEERTPFARVGAGNDWWVVDETGVPFRAANSSDANLYALTSPRLEPIVGRRLAAREWQSAAGLIRAVSTQAEPWPLRRIYLDKNGFASLRLQGGLHDEALVRLGGDRWKDKLGRARLALKYIEAAHQRAQTLNFVSYTMPQWTPVPATNAASTDDVSQGA